MIDFEKEKKNLNRFISSHKLKRYPKRSDDEALFKYYGAFSMLMQEIEILFKKSINEKELLKAYEITIDVLRKQGLYQQYREYELYDIYAKTKEIHLKILDKKGFERRLSYILDKQSWEYIQVTMSEKGDIHTDLAGKRAEDFIAEVSARLTMCKFQDINTVCLIASSIADQNNYPSLKQEVSRLKEDAINTYLSQPDLENNSIITGENADQTDSSSYPFRSNWEYISDLFIGKESIRGYWIGLAFIAIPAIWGTIHFESVKRTLKYIVSFVVSLLKI